MILNDDRAIIWFLLCKNIFRYYIVLYHDCYNAFEVFKIVFCSNALKICYW